MNMNGWIIERMREATTRGGLPLFIAGCFGAYQNPASVEAWGAVCGGFMLIVSPENKPSL